VYALGHPHAVTARYQQTTIARNGLSGMELAGQAIANWAHDVDPWFWATSGDPAPYIHVGAYCSLFGATVALALAGLVLVVVRHRDDLWWRYVVLATVLVPVPAALTVDRHNAIRLAALPVFVLVLTVPALVGLATALRQRSWVARAVALALTLAVAAQFSQFVHVYRTNGPGRVVLFDAGVAPLLEQPFESGKPIYIDYDDRGAQAEARWHAVAAGLPADRIVVLPDGGIPPEGSTVFGRFQECDYICTKISRWDDYWVARADGPKP
jgi:hypothetical protein